MTRPAAPAVASLALAALLAPALARALPPENTTRIAVMGGYRYQPNARFLEWAEINGHVPRGPSPGGAAILGVFGYRPLPELEISIELGFNWEQFGFVDEKPMQLMQMPIDLALRYAPWGGKLYPYFGVGYGYVLNFFSDAPGGAIESHAAGPIVLAGGAFELSNRVSVLAEARYSYSRVEVQDLGYLQTGGLIVFLGIQLAFPPEDKHLD